MKPKNGHPYPRLGFKMEPPETMTDFPRFRQNFTEIMGNRWVSKWPLFGSQSRLRIAQMLGKIKVLWARVEMMSKMGHS